MTKYISLIIGVACFFIISVATQGQDAVPFRSDSTYDFKLNYDFKLKPPAPHGEITYGEYYDQSTNEMLPYVTVNISLLWLGADDYRVKVINNQGVRVYSKKMRLPMDFNVDLGFAEDLKEKLVPYLYNIYFFDKNKNVNSKITLEVTESGDFLLNDEVYGKL
ncbi:hypothetical protein JMN32_04730 [Fulvivirga sp. 29W222]|uniref:Beta-lactamase-inhibitor-like PepSY-like domain-containing protein n=1 Tax=Fulvivirga marina TaxID=2494733 RepID=A0A937FZ79_9BACT|nr:hypothetical protein [Fulvivirga marina]MBL6445601.1 hypothetical protein [Fulvivirga marina]